MLAKIAKYCSQEKWQLIAFTPLLLTSFFGLATPAHRRVMLDAVFWYEHTGALVLVGIISGLMLLLLVKGLLGFFRTHRTINAVLFTLLSGAGSGLLTDSLIDFFNVRLDSSRISYSNVATVGSFTQRSTGNRGQSSTYSGFVSVQHPDSKQNIAFQLAYHLPDQGYLPPPRVSFVYGKGFFSRAYVQNPQVN